MNVTTAYEYTTTNPTTVDNGDEVLTFLLQILVIVSAMLSISWSAVTLKRVDYEEDEFVDFTLADYVLELIWSILCISSRVIALALFATVQTHWFAGLLAGQVVIAMIILFALPHTPFIGDVNDRGETDYCVYISLVILFASNSVFNIFLPSMYFTYHLPYLAYAVYWVLMMVENTVFITIWYISTNGQHLWYHTPAIVYVIVAYLLSFIVKTFYASIMGINQDDYNSEEKAKPITKWRC